MTVKFTKKTILIALAVVLLMLVSCTPEDFLSDSRTDKVGINSKILGRIMTVEIHLPRGYSEKTDFPVLYMLHDYANKESSIRETELFNIADILTEQGIIEPMIIVAPQIDNSFLLNSSEKNVLHGDDGIHSLYSGMYEDYFADEIIPYIERTYSVISDREGRYIGGISTGGYAALRMAFSNPDMFIKAGGHMPTLWTPEMELKEVDLFGWFYRSDDISRYSDITKLASGKNLDDISIYIDCGDEDSYSLPGAEELVEVLNMENCTVQFARNEGEHNFDYIVEHIEDYLIFYSGSD